MINLYDLTRAQLTGQVARWCGAPAHGRRIWAYLYRERVSDIGAMRELPARLLEVLQREAYLWRPGVAAETVSDAGLTRKQLLELADGRRIEAVLMQFRGRQTACLSTQAGCALGCVFCATGQMGFERNLSVGEIVGQAIHVDDVARSAASLSRASAAGAQANGRPGLRNLVLMGMGEPLHNYDAVCTALETLSDPTGLAIGTKQITISTVGVIPGIVRLAEERRPYSLAVSLHAATQDERAALIPAARAWPLDELLEACRYYTAALSRRIFFEWTLIAGQNDSPEQAATLARLLHGIPAQINLIPLNPTSGYSGLPGSATSVERFKAALRERGLPVTVRQRRGIDIAAGCGQLATAGSEPASV